MTLRFMRRVGRYGRRRESVLPLVRGSRCFALSGQGPQVLLGELGLQCSVFYVPAHCFPLLQCFSLPRLLGRNKFT